jgi:long-chain acyl-CoA synthetase
VNLAAIVEDHPSGAPAVLGRDRDLTYGELREEVARLRGGLAAGGVKPGDRVMLALANDWPFAVAYLATLGVGAVAVPVDPTLPAPALDAEMKAVGVTAAWVGPQSVAAMSVTKARSGLGLVVAAPGAEGPDGATRWADLSGPDTGVVERRGSDPAALIFTAGTAGSPKAAILTHASLRSNLEQVQAHPGRALLPGDVSYGVLPLFHVFGLNVVLGLSLLAGAAVLMVERFQAEDALVDIPGRAVSLLAGSPPLFAALTGAGRGHERALDGVRLCVSGAAALGAEVAREFEARFRLPLWQGYGLTEASPVVTSSVIGGVAKPGSVGVPIPGVEIRIVDVDGEDAYVGDSGELWVRGPNVFGGYWNNPEATAAVLGEDGWLRTGDVAVADDDGYLYLVDRSKDLIIVSGFNVFPAEVEEVLRENPEVADAAVVGVPDPVTGEAVHAYVVAAAGVSPDTEGLRRWCRAHLAAYKCPDAVMVVGELPKGLGGKLLRRALRH